MKRRWCIASQPKSLCTSLSRHLCTQSWKLSDSVDMESLSSSYSRPHRLRLKAMEVFDYQDCHACARRKIGGVFGVDTGSGMTICLGLEQRSPPRTMIAGSCRFYASCLNGGIGMTLTSRMGLSSGMAGADSKGWLTLAGSCKPEAVCGSYRKIEVSKGSRSKHRKPK